MRVFAILFAVLAVCHSSKLPISGKVFEDEIKQVVECIKENLVNGIPEVNLPSFEPLWILNQTFEIKDISTAPGVSGTVTYTNFVMTGITDWQFESLEGNLDAAANTFTATFKITNPQIALATQYDMKIDAGNNLNVSGNGVLSFAIENEYNAGTLKVSLSDSKLLEANVEIGIDSINFLITGLYNDEEYSAEVSEYITENLKSILEENKEIISETFGKQLIEMVNSEKEPAVQAIIDEIKARCLI